MYLSGSFSYVSYLLDSLTHHKRNVFCLPRQKAFFSAFWAKIGQNQAKQGFGAVDRLLRSPIFCFRRQEKPENAGVLFAFLCSVKKTKKCPPSGIWTFQKELAGKIIGKMRKTQSWAKPRKSLHSNGLRFFLRAKGLKNSLFYAILKKKKRSTNRYLRRCSNG